MNLYKVSYNLGTEKKLHHMISKEKLDNMLENQNINIYSIKKIRIKSKKFSYQFVNNMNNYITNGFSLNDAIKLSGATSKEYKEFYDYLRYCIESGTSLYSFLFEFRSIFPNYYLEIINISNKSNDLESGFKLIMEVDGYTTNLKNNIIKQSIYPIIVLIMAFLIFIGIFTFIIPNFKQLYDSIFTEIPKNINLLFTISENIKNFFPLIIIALIVFIYFMIRSTSRIKNHIPIVKKIIFLFDRYKIYTMLHLLFYKNFPIDTVMEIIQEVSEDNKFKNSIFRIIENINSGKSLSSVFDKDSYFNKEDQNIILIGENVGNYSNSFKLLKEIYKEKIEKYMILIINLIQPLVYIFLGIIIILVVLFTFYPILQIMDSL